MDRNPTLKIAEKPISVALHPEGVDRNPKMSTRFFPTLKVALHPEGVDRNSFYCCLKFIQPQSPSTRRAWIEIKMRSYRHDGYYVALHPEGVDRNML